MTWLVGVARDRNSEIELRQVALRSAGQYWDRGNGAGLEVKESKGLGKMLLISNVQTFRDDDGATVFTVSGQAIYY